MKERISQRMRSAIHVLAPVLIVGAGFGAAYFGLLPRPAGVEFFSADATNVRTYGEHRAGDELLLVYVGSSQCAAARDPGLVGEIRQLGDRIATVAAEEDLGFATMGVATNWDPREGFGHLTDILDFDEMVVGRNWANMGLIRYVWANHPGRPATPQIIILRRTLQIPAEDGSGAFVVRNEQVLARLVGTAELSQWRERISGAGGIERQIS